MALCRIFDGASPQLLTYLSGQLGVLKTQAQMLLGLSGLVVTVTGFSGHHMIRGGSWPAGLMVSGIALVAVAVVLTLTTLVRLRWVSQDLSEELVETIAYVIERRNRQQRLLSIAGIFVGLGLAAYFCAVATAAASNA